MHNLKKGTWAQAHHATEESHVALTTVFLHVNNKEGSWITPPAATLLWQPLIEHMGWCLVRAESGFTSFTATASSQLWERNWSQRGGESLGYCITLHTHLSLLRDIPHCQATHTHSLSWHSQCNCGTWASVEHVSSGWFRSNSLEAHDILRVRFPLLWTPPVTDQWRLELEGVLLCASPLKCWHRACVGEHEGKCCVSVLAGNRQDIHRDERHPGGPADQPEGVPAEHHVLHAWDQQAGGIPPAHPGGPHLRQPVHFLHNGGNTLTQPSRLHESVYLSHPCFFFCSFFQVTTKLT